MTRRVRSFFARSSRPRRIFFRKDFPSWLAGRRSLLLVWPWLCSPQCRMPKLKVRWWRKYISTSFFSILFYSSFYSYFSLNTWKTEKTTTGKQVFFFFFFVIFFLVIASFHQALQLNTNGGRVLSIHRCYAATTTKKKKNPLKRLIQLD